MEKFKLLFDDYPYENAYRYKERSSLTYTTNLPFFTPTDKDKCDIENEVLLYPICLGDFITDLVFHNRFGQIPEYVLDALRDENSKLFLLLWFPTEGFSCDTHPFMDVIDFCIKHLGILSKKVIFVSGDLKIRQNYKHWRKLHGWAGVNVIPYEYFSTEYKYCAATWFDEPLRTLDEYDEFRKTKKEKRFIFKNAVLRDHRKYLIGRLEAEGMLQHAYWSMLDRYVKKFNPDEINIDLFRKFSADDDVANKSFKSLHNLYSKGIKTFDVDLDKMEYNQSNYQWQLESKYYNTSDFSLVSETVWSTNTKVDCLLFLSEKIYQPIANLHPFIVTGSSQTLKYLQSRGYATFPELFNEDYDSQENSSVKMNMLVDNVKDIVSGSKDNILQSNEIRDKLIHNKEVFNSNHNFKQNVQFIVSALKKIVGD